MPTTTNVGPATAATIASGASSPVTLSIPPHSDPMVITITSASAITVTAQSTYRTTPVLSQP